MFRRARQSKSGCGLEALNAKVRRLASDLLGIPARRNMQALKTGGHSEMPKFVIERDIPGAGNLSPQDLKGISQTSCGVLSKMGPQIQWVQSYVTGDKVYCVYIAPNEQMVRDHAQQGGFPANRVSEVSSIIDPTTAE